LAKVFISSGDPSGDVHAARLMSELLTLHPHLEFVGIGGQNMKNLGLRSIAKIEDISVVGFWEVAKRYCYFRKLMNECKSIIQNDNVIAFIPIDYPGFNIPLASFAKNCGKKVIYYIAPQLWAWGSNRARKLACAVDLLLVVFPFEQDFFNNYNINTKFVGHPLLDNPVFQANALEFENRENVVAILPGSRQQEINKHLELFAESAKLFKDQYPNFQIILAKSLSIDTSNFNDLIKKNKIEITLDSIELMKKAKIGIVKTGTSNLEAALAGMPFSMVYKTSFLTYKLAKSMLNLPYISIVNILENDSIIDELIQSSANKNAISESLINIIQNDSKRIETINRFKDIKFRLGGKGASENAAKEISLILNILY